MKKIYYLAAAMTLATMVGCQNEDEVLSVQEVSEKTFYATFEGGTDTRTALSGEQNKVIWLAGDQISVFGGNTTNNTFILDEGENTTYGTFRVNSASAGTESNGSVTKLSANAAYYPYDSNVTISESDGSYTFHATFPATQVYSESGTFGNGASPMVAVTSSALDADLMFKNVGAIFRLQLKGTATITQVVFSADADLAGKCDITASNTTTPTVSVTEGAKSIILDCGEGVQLSESEATNFVVAMLPVENITGGMTITIYDNAGKKMVYTHKSDTFTKVERSKAYTTTEVTYNGNETANTPISVQAALDAATTGATIQLEPGVNYGTLYIRPVKDASHTQSGDWITSNYQTELARTIENVTIQGASGAKVDAIEIVTGYKGSDYITDAPDLMCYANIKGLVIDGVEFTDNTTATGYNSPIYINLQNTNVDGLTVKNCKLTGTNTKTNLVYIYGSQGNHTYSTASKNVTITSNTVEGIARLCELRETENVTITDNIIKNTAEHAILLAANPDAIYSGNITITGNNADGIGDRFVRMAGAGAAKITINGNVITNYKGEDADCIKVDGRTSDDAIDTKNNTFEVASTEALQAALDVATEGTVINLVPNVNYGVVYMGRPTRYNNTEMSCGTHSSTTYNAENFETHLTDGEWHTTPQYTTTLKNLTINGATGATIGGLAATSGHVYGDVYDYVLDKDYTSGSAYYSTLNISGVTFSKINFTGKVDINTSDATSVYDGISFKECTFTTGGTESSNGAAIHYYNESNNGNVKNITVDNCTFTSCYQGVYVHHVNGITVTGNTFDTTGHNAIAIQSHGNETVDLKNVVITDNTFKKIGDRIIRFGNIGTDSNITIQRNTATDSGDKDGEVMKAVSIANGITTSISGNNWGDGKTVANDELKDQQ